MNLANVYGVPTIYRVTGSLCSRLAPAPSPGICLGYRVSEALDLIVIGKGLKKAAFFFGFYVFVL